MTSLGDSAPATFRALVRQASEHGTTTEMLELAEALLAEHSPALLLDAELTTQDYRFIADLLADLIANTAATSPSASPDLTHLYPHASLAALVAEAYGIASPAELPVLHAPDAAATTDATIEQHAGLSRARLDRVFDALTELAAANPAADNPAAGTPTLSQPEEFARVAATQLAPTLATSGEDHKRLEGLLYLVAELFAFTRAHGAWPDVDFEDNHGLPEPVFAQVHRRLAKLPTPSPSLVFDPDTLTPSLHFGQHGTGLEWAVIADGIRQRFTPTPDSPHFRIVTPFSRIVASCELGSWEFTLDEALSRGLYFVDQSNHFLRNQESFGLAKVTVLTPVDTKLTAKGAGSFQLDSTDLGPVTGWPDWHARRVDLAGVQRLVITDGASRCELRPHGPEVLDWREGEPHNLLRGPRGIAVLTSSPEVLLPSEEWSITTVAVGADSQRTTIESAAAISPGRFCPVLPATGSPWVGQFESTISHLGAPVETRLFTIAESVNCEVRYKHREQDAFITPEDDSAAVEFTSGHAAITIPHGEQPALRAGTHEHFELTSSTFSLPVTVSAPALTYLLPRRGKEPEWSATFEAVSHSRLDTMSHIAIRFPQAVERAELVAVPHNEHADSPVRVRLSRSGRSTVWTCPAARLLARLDLAAEHTLAVVWYTTSDWDFLQSLSKGPQRSALMEAFRTSGTFDRAEDGSAQLAALTAQPDATPTTPSAHSLDQLRASFPAPYRVAAAIESGLAFRPFASTQPSGRADWIDLLHALVRAGQESGDTANTDFLRDHGAQLLPAWRDGHPQFFDFALSIDNGLSQAASWNDAQIDELIAARTPSLISHEERRGALAELALHHHELTPDELGSILALADSLEPQVTETLGIAEVTRALAALRADAQPAQTNQPEHPWLLIPHASAVFAFHARLTAHGHFTPAAEQAPELQAAWHRIATSAPRLAAFDLVCAEAITLGQLNR